MRQARGLGKGRQGGNIGRPKRVPRRELIYGEGLRQAGQAIQKWKDVSGHGLLARVRLDFQR